LKSGLGLINSAVNGRNAEKFNFAPLVKAALLNGGHKGKRN
jgi:hypothetical protein